MTKFFDEGMKTFLDNLLAEPVKEEEPYDLDVKSDDGEENSSQEEMNLKDLRCEFNPKYLKDHLPIFADAEEIIKMHQLFEERPELRYAERSEREGGCDSCEADSGCSGKKGKKSEDK